MIPILNTQSIISVYSNFDRRQLISTFKCFSNTLKTILLQVSATRLKTFELRICLIWQTRAPCFYLVNIIHSRLPGIIGCKAVKEPIFLE